MFLLLFFGNLIFDKEDRSFLLLKSNFSSMYDQQIELLSNRTRIQILLKKEVISKTDHEILQSLWNKDHSLILSQLIMMLETNEKLPYEYQINEGSGKAAVKKWVNEVSNNEKLIVVEK